MASKKKKSVLFICLGNICRSPIAEAVFKRLLAEERKTDEWEVDSAAMGDWHIGKGPDSRAMKTLNKMGITDYVHRARQWEVDSAAMGSWHIGKGPDSRAMKTLNKMGITDYVHRARQVCVDDFTHYDVIFGMDDDNMRQLNDRKPNAFTAKLLLLGEYDPEGEIIIRDPYFDNRSDMSGFEKVYEQCVRCCKAFLDKS